MFDLGWEWEQIMIFKVKLITNKKTHPSSSLVVQWINPPANVGTQSWKDSTCQRAKKTPWTSTTEQRQDPCNQKSIN